jgi:hypothetical protein
MLKEIIKAIGRFISMLLLGTVVSLMASGVLDIHYFFIRLRNTSGLDSLKSWLISGIVIGIIVAIVINVLALKNTSQPKDAKLFSLIFLRFVIAATTVTAITLTIWNYYKFDYFRLKDAGPVALAVGLIWAMWDLSSHITKYINQKSTS